MHQLKESFSEHVKKTRPNYMCLQGTNCKHKHTYQLRVDGENTPC